MRLILAAAALSAVGANELVPRSLRSLTGSGFCAAVGTPPTDETGAACTCEDTTAGFKTGCSATTDMGYPNMAGSIPVTINVQSSFTPCADPASMGYSATGTFGPFGAFSKIDFTLAEQTVGAGSTALIAIPGAGYTIPVVGGIGLYIAATLTGSAEALSFDIGITLCASAGTPTLASCTPSTPFAVVPKTTFPSFSDLCTTTPGDGGNPSGRGGNGNGDGGSGGGKFGKSGIGGGAIAGIVIGVLAAVGVVAGAVYYRNMNAAASFDSADSASAKGAEVENPAVGNNL